MPSNSENVGKGCATLVNFVVSLIVLIILVVLLMPGLIKLPKWANDIRDLRILETRHTFIKPTLFQNQANKEVTHLLIPNLRLKDISTQDAINKLKEELPITVWLTYKQNGLREPLWESPLQNCYTHNIKNVKTLADRLNVYVTDANVIKAFQKIDGKLLWEQRLTDYLGENCEDCFILKDEKLLALTKDRILQAIDANNGKTLWRVRLHNPNKQKLGIRLINDKILVLLDQENNNSNSPKGLFFYNIDKGQQTKKILFQSQTLDTPVFFTKRGIYILDKDEKNIILKAYDASLKQIWQVVMPSYFSLDKNIVLNKWWRLVDGYFYFIYRSSNGGQAILKINLTNKQMTNIYKSVDYEIEFLETSYRFLMLSAKKNRGTIKNEFWQLDNQGKLNWKYDLSYYKDIKGLNWQAYIWKQYLVFLERKGKESYTLDYIKLSNGLSEKKFNYKLKPDKWNYAFLAEDEIYLGVRNLYSVNLNTGRVGLVYD